MDGNLDDIGGLASSIFLCCMEVRRVRNKRGDVFCVVICIIVAARVNDVNTEQGVNLGIMIIVTGRVDLLDVRLGPTSGDVALR